MFSFCRVLPNMDLIRHKRNRLLSNTKYFLKIERSDIKVCCKGLLRQGLYNNSCYSVGVIYNQITAHNKCINITDLTSSGLFFTLNCLALANKYCIVLLLLTVIVKVASFLVLMTLSSIVSG